MTASNLMSISLVVVGCLALAGCTEASMYTSSANLPDTPEPHWAKDAGDALTSQAEEKVASIQGSTAAQPRLGWAGQKIHPIQEGSFDARSESSPFTKSKVACSLNMSAATTPPA